MCSQWNKTKTQQQKTAAENEQTSGGWTPHCSMISKS
jgi:hypothetical protein